MNILQAIGRVTLSAGAAVWDVSALFFRTLYWLFFAPFIGKFIGRRYIFAQMVFAGVQSLMIVFFVALFIGIVLAMQGAYQLNQLGAVRFVAALISVSMCREIGPVLIALVVAGRLAGNGLVHDAGFHGPGAALPPESGKHLLDQAELDAIDWTEARDKLRQEIIKALARFVFKDETLGQQAVAS